MGALAWLGIPLLGICAAALWARWAAHSRTTTQDGASLAGYERFRQAMQSPPVPAERPPGGGDEDSPSDPVADAVP